MEISRMRKSLYLYFMLLAWTSSLSADKGIEFFEAKIRPVLVEHCYECHNSSGKAKAKLILDYKAGLLKGGSEGPSIVPGKPEESLILQTIRHEFEDLRMPKDGPRLDKKVLEDFRKWIAMGAPDPRDKPPSAEQLAKTTSWEAIRERRKKWWSFQPVVNATVPKGIDKTWSDHPVDNFLLAGMEKAEIAPNEEANALAVLRRLTFAITGLPPTPEQQETYAKEAAENTEAATEKLVVELLAKPQFGERWGRHWMDWVRYADSHGSEGDPNIPNAFRYRNYLIRALNGDVPYDQLVREHLAGDLLPDPRVNDDLGLNESAIGTANLRFVLHGFAPTDALDEHVRFTDDQIDVVTKAFLGLTVSCARCHDHKFDAISQKDYYALFGILSNGRPAQRVIDSPALLKKNLAELGDIKKRIHGKLAKVWKDNATNLADLLQKPPSKKWQDAIGDGNAHNPLRTWAKLRNVKKADFAKGWDGQRKEYQASQETLDKRHSGAYRGSWKLGKEKDYASWSRSGPGLGGRPSLAGSFHVLPSGDRILDRILPSGAYTHLLSTKHNGTLSSPRFTFDEGNVWIRATGDKGTSLRYVVWNYPRRGTVYPKGSADPNQEKWVSWNTKYWSGDQAYLEATTNRDHPVEAGGGARSWMGVTEAILAAPGQPAPRDEIAETLAPIFDRHGAPVDADELAMRYTKATSEAIDAWEKGKCTDAQARMLSYFVKKGLLPVTLKELPAVADLVSEYRLMEAEVASPRLAPGILDNQPFDQPLFTRGDHKKPGNPVPRRFLEAIDDTPYPKNSLGRLEYAEDIVRPDNPLAARVIVNRLWHHLFGRGLVGTPDNFGRLGEQPSHPELLDYLAQKFRKDGWSIKKMIGFLATTKAFRLSSRPSAESIEKDPDNLLLSHAHLKRLEAEPIRDSLLAVSMRLNLDRVAEGGSENGNTSRRAIYRQVKRNSLDAFLSVFDAPVPATAQGRRDVTNVPAQSLTLMNDPFVINAARDFAKNAKGETESEKISGMFRLALGRPAEDKETAKAIAYLQGASAEQSKALSEKLALEKDLSKSSKALASILDPMRAKILDSRKKEGVEAPVGPKPTLHWNFVDGWKDAIHGITAHPKKGARIENGVLVVRGGGHVVTDKLPLSFREKTLEAWVKLDNLNQRAGGIVTIQSPTGSIFDSIVFAEQEGRRWMAGSNGFRRTKSFGGTEEKEADKDFVHVAITYQSDGTITGYRNGRAYGKSYKTGKASFPKGNSLLSFGVRHLPVGPGRSLDGQIREVRIYDRSLEPDAVIASFGGASDYVSEKDLLAALSTNEQKDRENIVTKIADLKKRLKAYDDLDSNSSTGLHDLALALFNMKEFIYLK
jgi:hypothetical protein